MTREEAIRFLGNTKVYVQGKSKEIQEKLFSLGFHWKLDGKKVRHEEKPFLFLWEDMELYYSSDMEHFSNKAFREITANDILNIVIDKPKYRPFKDAQECFEEMQKHQPFGWIISRKGEMSNLLYISSNGIVIYQSECRFDCAIIDYVFADGTPFGIKEEYNEDV